MTKVGAIFCSGEKSICVWALLVTVSKYRLMTPIISSGLFNIRSENYRCDK